MKSRRRARVATLAEGGTTLRRALLGFVAAAAPLLACQVLVGIEDDRFTVAPPTQTPEASADAPPQPDLCEHRGPPPRPEGGLGGDGRRFVLAVDSYVLDDQRAGFDLDQVCTCDPLDRSKGAGQATCIAPTDQPACDEEGGIDNRLGSALAPLKDLVVDVGAIFNQQVECGGETLLLVLSNYNGEADDIDVKLSVVETLGILDDSDGGTDAGTLEGCAVDGQPRTLPPKRDGTDVWNVPLGASTPGARTEVSGWVKNFQLVADARQSTSTLPFYFGRTLVTLSGVAIMGQLVPLDGAGKELPIVDGRVQGGPATAFRLTRATLAGRAPARQVVVGAGLLKPDVYVCNALVWPLVKNIICGAPDTVHNIGLDLAGQPCDAISVGARFEAVPAILGPERPRTETTPCGPDWDKQSCD